MAKKTKFIRRQRKLKALDFFLMMTFGTLGITNRSLAAMITSCSISMCRESLHERFTAEAVVFMEESLKYVFKQQIRFHEVIETKLLDHFQNVYLVDSSSWDVDPNMKEVFPGCGGSASQANCKVQIGYEYKQGHISLYELTKGTCPDSKYTTNLPKHLKKNDLILFDLGYFCMKTFNQIIQRKAYFLSRFIYNTALYDPVTLERIDLIDSLRKSGNIFETNLLMGGNKKSRISCRLIAIRVSEEVANKRRRDLKKRGKRGGYK
ncbi:IS4 family transposase, partial [bacterium]|nr:IS4 family transposase [bacterium]